ncbi:hypothetical protein LWI28_009712 [Acer negundo]|uniref:Protein FAR1-RELATED SEQUENCE n=1 Tax=Acer negundo TaxID=4023 RepID=A0AAD5NRS1_ACENE|nr:hypothetical protein LWI28_009712 [Acer negundo]
MDSGEADALSHQQVKDVENNLQTLPRVDIDVGRECQSPKETSDGRSCESTESERDCRSQSISSIDTSWIGIDSQGCQTSEVSSANKFKMDVDGEQQSQSTKVPSSNFSGAGTAVKDEEVTYVIPKVGMEFESEDQAYKCYSRYAVLEGFSIRKDFVNKSRVNGAVVSRRYTCYRQGYRPTKHNANERKPRQETRTGCLAHMTIARQPNGRFRVNNFETKHNHEFVTPNTAHVLPSQKRLTFAQAVEADLANNSSIDVIPKLGMGFDSEDHAYDFYNAYAGQVGFSVRKDYVNRSKIDGAVASRRFTCFREGFRQKDKRDMNVKRSRKETRIGCLAQLVISRQSDGKYRVTHFKEDHNHELVAACRVRMLRSQKKLAVCQVVEGDVQDVSKVQPKSTPELSPNSVGDDHGYNPINYKSKLPSKCTRSMKVGEVERIQHYLQKVMSGKKPKTILTDEDAVLAEAIDSALPETNHRICVWHVYKKVLRQLNHGFVGSDSFINDLCSCFFDHEEEEDFVNAWKVMLDVYGLWENEWLDNIFKDREKWAIAYQRHIFCADVKAAQLHEDFTANLRKYLKSDSDVLSFVKHLGKMVNDWHYKELEANYDMNQQMPRLMGDVILLKHVRDVYTPKIFELFQQEYETCLNIVVNQCTENGSLFEYKVSIYGQHQVFIVTYNSLDETVACNCMKFEFMGVLCSHALKVLDYRNIKVLPSHYILKRWTRDARV